MVITYRSTWRVSGGIELKINALICEYHYFFTRYPDEAFHLQPCLWSLDQRWAADGALPREPIPPLEHVLGCICTSRNDVLKAILNTGEQKLPTSTKEACKEKHLQRPNNQTQQPCRARA